MPSTMIPKNRAPTTVGQYLKDEHLHPPDRTPEWLATQAAVPLQTVHGLLEGRERLTAELASKLSAVLGVTDRMLMTFQNNTDLFEASRTST